MKKAFAFLSIIVALATVYLHYNPFGARIDRAFDATVSNPAYTDHGSVMLFDEGHHNFRIL